MAAGAVARVGREAIEGIWDAANSSGALTSGEAMLRRYGPLGESLAAALRTTKDKWETRAGKMLEYRAPIAGEAHKAGLSEQIINDLERKAPASHPLAKQVSDYDRLLNAALVPEAQSVGIKVGPLVPDDFHHMWDPEIFSGVNEVKAINHLVGTGQVATRDEARTILERLQRRGGMVHSLETPRSINLPGYRRDLAVMSDHFTKTFQRIEEARTFGPKDEKLHQLIDAIEAQHGRRAAADARLVAQSFLGRGAIHNSVSDLDNFMGQGVYRKIASVEAVAHLGLAFISHSMQGLNSVVVAARSGLTPTIRALKDMIVDHGNAADFAIRSASTMQSTLHDFRRLVASEMEKESLGGKLLRYTPFQFIDKQRRIFAARVGAAFVEDEFQKFLKDPTNVRAVTNLRLMGIDAVEAQKLGGLQQNHLLRAAKTMSDVTQFRSDALSLPPKWTNQDNLFLRLAVMYKQFFFHQAKFVKDQVLMPAFKEGEMRPLMYMALLFPSFGEVVGDVKEFARKGDLKDRPGFDKNHWMDRLIDNYSQVGGFGIMSDLITAFAQPGTEPAFRFVVGPAISDVIEGAKIPFQPHPIEAVEKKILRSVPVVGPIASKKVFPPKTPRKGPLQRGVVTRELNKILGI